MQEQDLDILNLFKNLKWSDQTYTPSMGYSNSYCLGKKENSDQISLIKKTIKTIHIPEALLIERRYRLEHFSHQNYIPISVTKIQLILINGIGYTGSFKTRCLYFKATPLSHYIKNKQKMSRRSLMSMIFQLVDLMSTAEKSNIYHYRINPSSILIQQNQNNPCYIKVCDWGFGIECDINDIASGVSSQKYLENIKKSTIYEYLHPEILFKKNDFYNMSSYKSKYDIWSFAIVLYKLLFHEQHVFLNQSKEFDLQKLSQYYKKQEKLNISSRQTGFLPLLIEKMLSLNSFLTWNEVKQYLINNVEITQVDFLPHQELYSQYDSLMSYFIQIYKLIIWSICHSSNCFWTQNQAVLKQILLSILKLMNILHQKFNERYWHKIKIFTKDQTNRMQQIKKLIKQESQKIFPSQFVKKSKVHNLSNIFQILQTLRSYLLIIQLKVQDYQKQYNKANISKIGTKIKDVWPSVRIVKNFNSELLKAIGSIKQQNKSIFLCFFRFVSKAEQMIKGEN